MEMKAKPVSASQVEMDDVVQPSDVNLYGTIFGGHLMSLVDKAAGIAAFKHSGESVVTISVDQLIFKNSAPVGTVLTIRASVNRAFHSSMEVGVRVTGWRPGSREEVLICPAYLTFVAVGPDKRPIPVQPVLPETPDQVRRYEQAGIRREARLTLAQKLVDHR
ncbi:MAG TPA: acyl-CoA thioesterase [Rectinemataceae bacterium]|nr:acyl-CoA thioesterase [Rectinemataceae bacterium]